MKEKKIKDKSLLSYYGFTKKDQKKYPVVSGILKELTPERIELEIKKIQEVKLPPELQKWVEEYEKVGGERSEFLWKWLYYINKDWYYIPIREEYIDSLALTKTLLNMFIILLDDASVNKSKKNIFEKLLNIPLQKTNKIGNQLTKNIEYYKFVDKLWRNIFNTIKKYPRYKELKDIFDFDIFQFLNAVKFTELINDNLNFININEYWIYLSHKMQILINFDTDLMCCISNIKFDNLGNERNAIVCLQKISRINNWITTWKREIKKRDFSSGVFVYLLSPGFVSSNKLKNMTVKEIELRISKNNIKKVLFDKWEKFFNKLNRQDFNTKLIRKDKILQKSKYFLLEHLINEDYI